MSEPSANHPVQVAEASWEDPDDQLMCGTYRVAIEGDPHDHLVVYIRGRQGEPTPEYRGETTICGRPITFGVRRVSDTCDACLDRAGQAFLAARAELARRAGG